MKKYENFCNAYRNLKDIYSYEEPYNNVELTGLVGLYEICFEQAWKMMKEKLTESGFAESATGSPRTILKTAYKAGMIVDEQSWLDALQARPLRMTKQGDARRSLDRRFPSYRQPSPRGEDAPKGRIGHRRYERQMRKAEQRGT